MDRPGGKSLGEEEVIYLRQQKVNDVCDVLQLEKTICMSLLNKYNWDVQKLLVAYAEDPEKTCENAGVKNKKKRKKKDILRQDPKKLNVVFALKTKKTTVF